MKKKFYLLWAVAVLIGCNDSIQEDIVPDVDAGSRYGVMSDGPHRVTLSDVTTLTKAQTNATRAAGVAVADSKVTCFVDAQQDTLLYICDKAGGGWTVYSSDTRVPAVVAQSSSGTYADAMQNEAARLWMEAIAEDMKHILAAADSALNFTAEEISANREFWRSVSDADAYVKEKLADGGMTRVLEIEDKNIEPIIGHYELISSKTHYEVYDSIARMTETDWNQWFPYNTYCPGKSNGNGNVPAGCVAIAAAQMLYFLHYSLGVPETAPSEAYCNGSVSTGYDWDQYNYTSGIWDEMNERYMPAAAPLVADIGRRLNMRYGDNGSGAYTRDLPANVFAPYGISCTYCPYDIHFLMTSLSQGTPVLLGAFSNVSGTDKIGHAFIVDRYKRVREVAENVYEWVYDYVPNGVRIPYVPDKYETVYGFPFISMIGMNWGWGYSYNNEWYSITGDWILGGNNYTISRDMVYNFSVIR